MLKNEKNKSYYQQQAKQIEFELKTKTRLPTLRGLHSKIFFGFSVVLTEVWIQNLSIRDAAYFGPRHIIRLNKGRRLSLLLKCPKY